MEGLTPNLKRNTRNLKHQPKNENINIESPQNGCGTTPTKTSSLVLSKLHFGYLYELEKLGSTHFHEIESDLFNLIISKLPEDYCAIVYIFDRSLNLNFMVVDFGNWTLCRVHCKYINWIKKEWIINGVIVLLARNKSQNYHIKKYWTSQFKYVNSDIVQQQNGIRNINFLVQYKTLSTYISQDSVGLKLDSVLGAAFALQLFVFDYENPPPLLGKIPLKSEFILLNEDNDLNNLVKM
ncbi:hypothetical protein ACJIZ3_014283 [Penstemon smallii]|uniref:Uncharacterized protein n=1 Tax=Penstemon smallii TaxID=265156 RepID=A0ABD3RUG2_9LAMI